MKKRLAPILCILLLIAGLPFGGASGAAGKTAPAAHALEGSLSLSQFTTALHGLISSENSALFPDLTVTLANAEATFAALENSGNLAAAAEELRIAGTAEPPAALRGALIEADAALSVETKTAERLSGSREKNARAALEAVAEKAAEEGFDVLTGTDTVVVSRPYQSARLLVEADDLPDTFGATAAVGPFQGMWALQFADEAAARAAREKLSALDTVHWAEPDAAVCVSDDGDFLSWGYSSAHMDHTPFLSWLTASADMTRSVTVAVVDTGAMYDHPFLIDRMDTERDYDFVNNDDDAYDDHFHGTHVSGTVADGTPANVKIVPVKVLDQTGTGYTSVIVSALWYCESIGVDVVNMSLGGSGTGAAYRSVIDALTAEGKVVCVAAGNSATDVKYNEPSNVESAITVAAVGEDHRFAAFSNYGDLVDIAAPGVSIQSAYPTKGRGSSGTFMKLSGTSMASPHVAAAAACIRLYMPGTNADDVLGMLQTGGVQTFTSEGNASDVRMLRTSAVAEENGLLFYISANQKLLYLGQSFRLQAVTGDGAPVVWETSDAAVCTVENGLVSAVGEGFCEITARCGEAARVCEVTVSPIGIRFGEEAFEMYQDCSYIVPYYVTHRTAPLRWESSNPEVLTVENGILKSHVPGVSTVTLTADPGGLAQSSASFTVTVKSFGAWYDTGAPFTLSSPEELLEYSYARSVGVTGGFVIDPTLEELDMTGIDWYPIHAGYDADGSNVPIRNLRYVAPEKTYAGFFSGASASAVIKNFILEDVYIVGEAYVGGLVGYVYGNAAVDSCSVTGKVEAAVYSDTINGGTRAGGVVGAVMKGSVRNCSARVTVSAGREGAGGVVGTIHGGEIENCCAYADADAPKYAGLIAGIAGISYNIDSSGGHYAFSAVRNTASDGTAKGAIVGLAYLCALTDCYTAAGALPFTEAVSTEVQLGLDPGRGHEFSLYADRWDAELTLAEEGASVLERLNKNALALSAEHPDREYRGWTEADGKPVFAGTETPSASIGIANRHLRMISRETETLRCRVYPAGQTVTFYSEDPLVAAVDAEGRITAGAGGDTRVWAETPDGRDYATVHVIGVGEWYDPDALTLTVSSRQDLIELSDLTNGSVDDFAGKTILQTADIDLSGVRWTPIAGEGTALRFRGVFDGQNHRITGLSSEPEDTEIGLFRELADGAAVRNVILEDVRMYKRDTASGAALVYILGSGCTVENCVVSGELYGLYSQRLSENIELAGLVWWNKGVIRNCRSSVSSWTDYGSVSGICARNSGVIDGCLWHGILKSPIVCGICALNQGGARILNCATEGQIIYFGADMNGLVWNNYGVILNCANHAELVDAPAADFCVTGIAGGFYSDSGAVGNAVNSGLFAHGYQICAGDQSAFRTYVTALSPLPAYDAERDSQEPPRVFDPGTWLLQDGTPLPDALNVGVDEINASEGENVLHEWSFDEAGCPVPFGACPHTVTGKLITSLPTCSEEGRAVLGCLGCGRILGGEYTIPAIGHDELFREQEPEGCARSGYKRVSCRRCNETLYQEILAIPHTPAEEYVLIQAPTCTSQGWEDLLCTVCGTAVSRRFLNRLEHEWGYVRTKEPGCFTPGDEARVCLVCGAQGGGRSVPAIGHHTPIPEEDEAVPATCAGNACTRSHCAVCGEYWNHDYVDGSALGHDYTLKIVSDGTVAYPASCSEPARYFYTCSRCGDVNRASVNTFRDGEPLGHAPGGWVTVTPSSCTAAGQEKQTCERCGRTLSIRALPLADHTPERVPGRAATCLEEGLTDGTRCAVCRRTLTEQTPLPLADHAWNAGEVSEQPSCTSAGIRTYTCSVCHHTREEAIDPLGHVDRNRDGVCDRGCGTRTSEPEKPDAGQDLCKYCGKSHTGFFGAIIRFFHNILYFFRNLGK